jgi:putative ABC transport system permease protein
MWQDIRLTVRGFRRTPVFSFVAIVTFALSIGATTALFSLLNALALRDVAVRDPKSLVQVSGIAPGSTSGAGLTFQMYEELQRRQEVFSAVIGWLDANILYVETDHNQTPAAVWVVSGNFYTELGIRPLAGRLLDPADVNETTLEPARVAVLGYTFWQRHYGGDRRAIGQGVRVEGESFEIVGIAPERFRALNLTIEPDVTLPLTAFPLITDGTRTALRNGTSFWVRTTGRLKSGMTFDLARAALDALWPALKSATVPPHYGGTQRDRFLATRLAVEPAARGVEPQLRQTFIRPVVIVLAIAGLFLLIACVNLASLMLSRAAARAPELRVRLALGAGRWRIARQLLVEGIVLSGVGAASGLWVAYWSSDALASSIFRDYLVAASLDVTPDRPVIIFTAAAAILAGALISVAPVWLAGRLESTAFPQQNTRAVTATGRTGKVLVGVQVGLSMILLTNAGLLVRTLQEIRAIKSGMQSNGVFVTSLAPRPGGRHVDVNSDSYYPRLLDRVSVVPGIEKAAASLSRPVDGGWTERVSTTSSPADQPAIESLFMPVSPGLFGVLGIPVKGGRDFGWTDNSRNRPVAIISDSLARRLFSSGNPIGEHIRVGVLPHRQDAEIVGVVGDARLYDLKNPNVSAVYVPALQEPRNNWKSLIIRGDRVSLEDLNRAVASFGYDHIRFTRPLEYAAARGLLRERIIAMLATFFGALALLLAAIGLYGLLSYAVAQRQREIGIRMALGADAHRVIRTVVVDGLMTTLIGLTAGLAAALVSVRLVKSLLFGVTTHDPATLVAAPVALIAVAVGACLIPAARAARTDPIITLRAE